MTTTYPIKPGSLTAADARAFLDDPTLIGERIVAAMGPDSFPLSNHLLQGRASLSGGVALIQPADGMVATEGVRGVAPGTEYPEAALTRGKPEVVEALKSGLKKKVTDEALTRDRLDISTALNNVLNQLGNGVQRHFERLSAAALTGTAIPTYTGTAWTRDQDGVLNLAHDLVDAYGRVSDLDKGFDPSVIAVTTTQWASITPLLALASGADFGALVTDGSINPWTAASWFVSSKLPKGWVPTLIDPRYFGGVAHETIDSEGTYVQVGAPGSGFEVTRFREPGIDARWIQVRKTDVPYIWNKDAAIAITGTGL